MIEIDGAYLEGGGQIIRTSLSLSSITQKPFRIFNIRAGRPNPGLQPQHLMACKAVRNISRGTLSGAEVGSRELTFEPGPIVGGKYEFDIGTAGSVTLVAQTIIPILLKASKESEVRITGGTHVMKSPGYDYFEKVFVSGAGCFGASIESKIIRPGYFPKGGGIIDLKITPSQLHGCSIWPQEDNVQVIIRLSGLDESIAIREKKIFFQNGIEKVYLRRDEALSVGNAVTAWKGLHGAYALGEKGKRAELVAKEALDALLAEKADVDLHLADQILLYAALAEGTTKYTTSTISDHLRTNAYVISKFLERKIEINGNEVTVS
jgi:RNA 3'-terminal phosphate cyclase (ATP)